MWCRVVSCPYGYGCTRRVLTGPTGTFGHARTSDSSKTPSVASIVQLNIRSIQVSACPCDLLLTLGSHVKNVISSRRRETTSMTFQKSARAGEDAAHESTLYTYRAWCIAPSARTRTEGAVPWSRLVIRRLTTENGINTFLIGCSCFSPTPCPIAVGPGRAHRGGRGACAHPGADYRAAAQRENEEH